MIPRTPVFMKLEPDEDDVIATPKSNIDDLARTAISQHTQAVRDWIAAPPHERGYHHERIKAAWHDVRTYGVSSQASAAANGIMQSHRKLKGKK